MAGIFKAYDIRGLYGRDLDENLARSIGRAFVTFLKCRKVVVGRDMRPHSTPLFEALAQGLTQQGADVIDLGLCSTPMSYFGNGSLQADAGIMITASHNPGEWNGFKLSRAEAVPISGQTGIADIERIVREESFAPPPPQTGTVSRHDVQSAYSAHIRRFAALRRPVRIVADHANAMGVVEARALAGLLEITPLYAELDGTFPNHEANPLKAETMADLQEKVREGGYDFGVSFDGDADRVGFVDENGDIVPMDLVSALIARSMLEREPGASILYDLRSSWAVREVIEESGGVPHMCRVGHAFIKQQMREVKGIFAGELSGHYYFRDNYYTESAALAVLCVANLVGDTEHGLAPLIRPLLRYSKSTEINSEVADVDKVLRRLKETYAAGEILELDGLSVTFPDWWFNVRSSNTEPLIRLNLEARTPEMLEARTAELLGAIRAP
ncbi:MAG: phosphomannomutase/phosphoglucomutase [Kiritimatiellia bacterium]|nr:phosphomannomutase/phosphoglucomutase [Lentisphaerota bacterium]